MNSKPPVSRKLTSPQTPSEPFQRYAFDRTISRPVRGHTDTVGPLWDNSVTGVYGEQVRKAFEGVCYEKHD